MSSEIQREIAMAPLADELYRKSYGASIAVMRSVIPFLRADVDTGDRLRSRSTAVPRLIAAGLMGMLPFDQRRDAMLEAALCCREAVVLLSYCRDLYGRFINGSLCSELIDTYRRMGIELNRFLTPPPEGQVQR